MHIEVVLQESWLFRVCPVQPGTEGGRADLGKQPRDGDRLRVTSSIHSLSWTPSEPLSNHPENNSCGINHNEVCAGSDSVLLHCLVKRNISEYW